MIYHDVPDKMAVYSQMSPQYYSNPTILQNRKAKIRYLKYHYIYFNKTFLTMQRSKVAVIILVGVLNNNCYSENYDPVSKNLKRPILSY